MVASIRSRIRATPPLNVGLSMSPTINDGPSALPTRTLPLAFPIISDVTYVHGPSIGGASERSSELRGDDVYT